MLVKKDIDGVAAEHISADGAVGVPEAKWFVAQVNSRHEKKVSERLQEFGLESFVATQEEMHIWKNGRRKKVERVVIPSVVFVRCTESKRREIVALPYINRFMVDRTVKSGPNSSRVAVIPSAQIAKLRFMLGQTEVSVNFTPTVFHVNDNVRVIRGRLAGLEGEILKKSDGTHTLTISLSLLGGATVLIAPQDVEKIL